MNILPADCIWRIPVTHSSMNMSGNCIVTRLTTMAFFLCPLLLRVIYFRLRYGILGINSSPIFLTYSTATLLREPWWKFTFIIFSHLILIDVFFEKTVCENGTMLCPLEQGISPQSTDV